MERARATRLLVGLLSFAFAVSVVHYLDNYLHYDDYPQGGVGPVPAPSATLVGLAWFVFTASGAAGLWLWLRGRVTASSVLLTGYSLSGLVGVAHYAVPGATSMVWWRQLHVVTDIACGLAVFAFALWAASRGPALTPSPTPARRPARVDGPGRASGGRPRAAS